MLKIVRKQLSNFDYVYSPSGAQKFPAILVLHGSEGGFSGWSHALSLLFAAHGFLAYPFNYSIGGNPWNAGSIKDIPLEHTLTALLTLRNFEGCTGKLGLYGVSRGAEHALLLASLMAREPRKPQPDAVAAHSPPDVICGAFDSRVYRDLGDPGWQAWDPAERAWTWHGQSENLKPTTPIEIEHFQGPLFLSHGLNDSVWSADMTKRLERNLKGRKAHLEVHYYEEQNHICWGEAENKHNELLLNFFEKHLAPAA